VYYYYEYRVEVTYRGEGRDGARVACDGHVAARARHSDVEAPAVGEESHAASRVGAHEGEHLRVRVRVGVRVRVRVRG